MIQRLHVRGFKNLIDTEVLLGPFNVILGENGVGKSNFKKNLPRCWSK